MLSESTARWRMGRSTQIKVGSENLQSFIYLSCKLLRKTLTSAFLRGSQPRLLGFSSITLVRLELYRNKTYSGELRSGSFEIFLKQWYFVSLIQLDESICSKFGTNIETIIMKQIIS